jgi:hypothetical protein
MLNAPNVPQCTPCSLSAPPVIDGLAPTIVGPTVAVVVGVPAVLDVPPPLVVVLLDVAFAPEPEELEYTLT